jgi:type VI secretion system secreted protein VgrG
MNAPLTLLQSLLMTQANRILKIVFPHKDGPKSAVYIENFDATERVNHGFRYTLKVISDDGHIELKEFMGKMVTVELEQANSTTPRYYNGYVTNARHAGSDGGLSFYELIVQPWTTLMEHRRDQYIFHNQTAVKSLQDIFADYTQFADHKIIVKNEGPLETFRVQYNETDFNYFNRRCEEKGWTYWFEHRADGHTLYVSDDSTTQAPAIEPVAKVRFQGGKTVTEKVDFIDQWHGQRDLQPSKVSLQSYDFKKPAFPLYSEESTSRTQGSVLQTEVYEYTGALAFTNPAQGSDLAALRLEEFEAKAKSFHGSGNFRGLLPGRYFELVEHFEHDQEANEIDRQFLILSTEHSASNNYLQKGQDAVYRNSFVAMRRAVPYRPSRNLNSTPVASPGIQTATVVGPPGEEIHCDEFGRVKVQFHWDRFGKMDNDSSCWVRVSSPWAGTNYGGIQLPRIGQEVIVDFLNGNMDQPIIVGRTYNQAQMPPWELPAKKNQSGFYSKSIGGGYDNANVMRFDDTAGNEELWLHAEKDQLTEVENDEVKWVGNDRKKTIDHDETTLVKNDRTETVNHDEKITINNDRTERVDHNEKISIGDNRSEDVGIDETITIGSNRTEKVGSNETITIGSNRTEKVGSNEDISIGKNRSKKIGANENDKIGKNWSIKTGKMKTETIGIANIENVGMARMSNIGLVYSLNVGMFMNTLVGGSQNEKVMQDKTVDVGKKLTLKAGEEIVLECGKSVIALKKDGTIFINGVLLHVNATTNTLVHGAKVLMNPAAPAQCYAPAKEGEESKSGAPGGEGGGGGGPGGAGEGASKFAAGPGSGPTTAQYMGALEGGGGMFGTLSKFAGMAQQAVGLAGMAKQAVSLFKGDKGEAGGAAQAAPAAPVAANPSVPAPAAPSGGDAGRAKPAAMTIAGSTSAATENFRGTPVVTPRAIKPDQFETPWTSDEELAKIANQTAASPNVDLATVALGKSQDIAVVVQEVKDVGALAQTLAKEGLTDVAKETAGEVATKGLGQLSGGFKL